MAAKEQERRKYDQKLKNLYEAIAEESDRDLRAGLSEKAKETKLDLDRAEIALLELKRDYEQSRNVVDISSAMEVVRVFRDGAFDAQPMATQAEILKSRIRRIIVRENGVYVEIYGRKREPILVLAGDQKTNTRPDAPVGGTRSGVRTVSKLVALLWQPTRRRKYMISLNSRLP